MDTNAWFDAAFNGHPIMVIVRGLGPHETVRACRRAWSLGITMVEVPVQTDDALPSLAAAVSAANEVDRDIGAGTVTTVDQVEAVAAVGARFTVAPGLDADVVTASTARGIPHLPGVSTPTEIQAARKLGLEWLKAFPADALGAGWFSAVRAPFPTVKLVATGGVGVADMDTYLTAGARAVSLGSALQDETAFGKLEEWCLRARLHHSSPD